jgi:uroporphyrinogen-III synthase
MNYDSGPLSVKNVELDMLHEIGNRIASADPLPELLGRVVEVISAVVASDSCFVYVLEGDELVLRASKNPHAEVVDRLKLRVGQGITGWVAEHKSPVAVARDAFHDSRFRSFNELPEDLYQAFLSVPVLSRDKLVGVINLQHRQPHNYSQEAYITLQRHSRQKRKSMKEIAEAIVLSEDVKRTPGKPKPS